MNRRRMLHAFKTELGEYEDAAVLPAETDPQIYLSRNRQPQPFHLICSKDNVLSQLSGAVHVHLRDSWVNRFRMEVGDHVCIPAGTPHRIVPVAEGVTLRYQPLEPGFRGPRGTATDATANCGGTSGNTMATPRRPSSTPRRVPGLGRGSRTDLRQVRDGGGAAGPGRVRLVAGRNLTAGRTVRR